MTKEVHKLRAENKDLKDYHESVDAELKETKQLLRTKDGELKMIKSDCAQALLGKEQAIELKSRDLQKEASDLQFQN